MSKQKGVSVRFTEEDGTLDVELWHDKGVMLLRDQLILKPDPLKIVRKIHLKCRKESW